MTPTMKHRLMPHKILEYMRRVKRPVTACEITFQVWPKIPARERNVILADLLTDGAITTRVMPSPNSGPRELTVYELTPAPEPRP